MKYRVTIFITLLLATFTATAMATDDTIRFGVTFPTLTQTIVLRGYCDVVIVPDTAEYLTTANGKGFESIPGFSYTIIGTVIIFDCPAGTPKLELHQVMSGSTRLRCKNYTRVVFPCCETAEIVVNAEDYSRVSFVPSDGCDSLRVNRLEISAEGYADVSMSVPCSMIAAELRSKGFSKVSVMSICGNVLTVYETNGGGDHARGHVALGEVAVPNDVTRITLPASSAEEDSSEQDCDEDDMESYDVWEDIMQNGPLSDFGLRYAIGLTNWGSSPLYGATKLGGAYALNTTLSSHSLEGIYNVGIDTQHRQKWVFGAGLGYESDVYKFANEYVDFADSGDGSVATFVAMDHAGDWTTRFVARYITVPLRVKWVAYKKFSVDLTVIPGMGYNGKHTGLKHEGKVDGEKAFDRLNLTNLMDFKLDTRLSLGWKPFYAFVQFSCLPMFINMTETAYPIKFGIMLEP